MLCSYTCNYIKIFLQSVPKIKILDLIGYIYICTCRVFSGQFPLHTSNSCTKTKGGKGEYSCLTLTHQRKELQNLVSVTILTSLLFTHMASVLSRTRKQVCNSTTNIVNFKSFKDIIQWCRDIETKYIILY